MLRRRLIVSRLFGATVLSAAVLMANAARADVTATDVWASYTAYYESTGAQVIGTPEADGADTVVSNHALLYRFPFGVATMRVIMPNMRMTDQSDGTVEIAFPDDFDLRIEVDVPNEGAGSITLLIKQDNFQGMASGTPDDVTFAQSADGLSLALKDIDIPAEDIDMTMQALMSGYSATSRVVTGDLITTSTEMQTGSTDIAYIVKVPDGGVISNTGRLGANEAAFQTALPAGGSNVMNLSAVLAGGAYLRGTSSAGGGTSETITTSDGVVVSEQFQATGSASSRFSIDAMGMDLFGEGKDIDFKVMMPDAFPFSVSGSLSAVSGGYKIPLLPSTDMQDVALQFNLRDLTFSDDIWGLFDPSGDLPRDPASINIDVSGKVISEIDALNFATLEAQMEQDLPPISLERLTLNEFSVSAIGTSALATGSFTLDNADTTTFDGFPSPEGSAILNVVGANALIDRLVTLGVIGQDEAGMARLGMGFIASATGDDAFESRVDVNGEGHVMVNGQRMR